MAFSPDSSRLASSGEANRDGLTVRDATTGKELFHVVEEGGTLRYSADGSRILCSRGSNGHTSMIDARTGEVLFRLQRDAKAATITPDGKRLLLVGQSTARPWPWLDEGSLGRDEDFTLWVGDALTGQEIANIPIPVEDRGARKCRAEISPDAEHIGVFFRDSSSWWWFEPCHPRLIVAAGWAERVLGTPGPATPLWP